MECTAEVMGTWSALQISTLPRPLRGGWQQTLSGRFTIRSTALCEECPVLYLIMSSLLEPSIYGQLLFFEVLLWNNVLNKCSRLPRPTSYPVLCKHATLFPCRVEQTSEHQSDCLGSPPPAPPSPSTSCSTALVSSSSLGRAWMSRSLVDQSQHMCYSVANTQSCIRHTKRVIFWIWIPIRNQLLQGEMHSFSSFY